MTALSHSLLSVALLSTRPRMPRPPNCSALCLPSAFQLAINRLRTSDIVKVDLHVAFPHHFEQRYGADSQQGIFCICSWCVPPCPCRPSTTYRRVRPSPRHNAFVLFLILVFPFRRYLRFHLFQQFRTPPSPSRRLKGKY